MSESVEVYVVSAYTERLTGKFARMKGDLYEHLSLSGIIKLSHVKDYLTSEQYITLKRVFSGEGLRFWGTSRGVGSKMRRGDWVIIYTDYCVYIGEIVYVMNNKRFARSVWGQTSKDRTWNYIFFLANVMELEHEELNNMIGKPPFWRPRKWYFAKLKGNEKKRFLDFIYKWKHH